MSIVDSVSVKETALWPQGDERDPLGIWGFRIAITGDASGGAVKVTARVPANQRSSFVYACYSALVVPITQAVIAGSSAKCRLLTNWPDIDEVQGVNGYGHLREATIAMNSALSTPSGGPTTDFITGNARFILLFDPRQQGSFMDIVELEIAQNILADVYAFEGWGYFWDRSVLNAPGGPRHPGAS